MTPRLRRLYAPRPVRVRAGPGGVPVAVDGVAVEAVREEWLVEDRWWTPRAAAPPLLRAGARRRPRPHRLPRSPAGAGTASAPEPAPAMATPLHTSSCTPTRPSPSSTAPRPRLELAAAAAELGYPALALTDHDGLWGSMEFAHACKGLGVRPITGAELHECGQAPAPPAAVGDRGPRARHAAGRRRDGVPQPVPAAHRRRMRTRGTTRRGRSNRRRRRWSRSRSTRRGSSASRAAPATGRWPAPGSGGDTRRAASGSAAACSPPSAASASGSSCSAPTGAATAPATAGSPLLAERLGVPAVATGDVHAHSRRRARLQDALVAVGLGETLEESEPRRRGNRSSALASPRGDGGALRRAPRGRRRDRPPRRAPALRPHRPSSATATPARATERPTSSLGEPLPRTAGRALRRRPAPRPRPKPASSEELATIRRLSLSGFFLLHHELLELAREVAAEVRGRASARAVLPPGRGRGSSVSSIVCYLTGLSHIDPVKAELFAGRFLNDGRPSSMPDIDLDFPRDIREALIPRVHEVYGADRSALVAAFPTYRPRGVVRDLGKALGLPPAEIEKVAKHGRLPRVLGGDRARRRRRARPPSGPPLAALEGAALALPRRARPAPPRLPALRRDGDLDRAADRRLPGGAGGDGRAPDRPVGQGLLRRRRLPQDRPARAGDALGGRALRRGSWRATRGERLDLSRIPLDDEQTFESIRAAETTGVFQIESRAQMQMLPRTRPRDIDDLTVQVALVRPGPIQGGAVHPYIERRKRAARGPRLRGPLRAPLAARRCWRRRWGRSSTRSRCWRWRSPSPASPPPRRSALRRAMSRKRSQQAIDAPPRSASSPAPPPGTARRRSWRERIWEKIQGFSGFGFPKAHSAAFGLLAYQSAWLRVHRGPEFLCALLNEQPMGFYPPDSLVHEAQRRGIRDRPARRQPQPRPLPRRIPPRPSRRRASNADHASRFRPIGGGSGARGAAGADRAGLREGGARRRRWRRWSPSASAAAPTAGSPSSPRARAPAWRASNGWPGPGRWTRSRGGAGGRGRRRRRRGPPRGALAGRRRRPRPRAAARAPSWRCRSSRRSRPSWSRSGSGAG